jgi:hypothetical protein
MSEEPASLVTIHALLASTGGGLDQSTTTGNRTEVSYVDDGCLNSDRGVIFPSSHRDMLISDYLLKNLNSISSQAKARHKLIRCRFQQGQMNSLYLPLHMNNITACIKGLEDCLY